MYLMYVQYEGGNPEPRHGWGASPANAGSSKLVQPHVMLRAQVVLPFLPALLLLRFDSTNRATWRSFKDCPAGLLLCELRYPIGVPGLLRARHGQW